MIADCVWVVGNLDRLKKTLPGQLVDAGDMLSWKLETKYYQAAIVFQKVDEDHKVENVCDLQKPEAVIVVLNENQKQGRLNQTLMKVSRLCAAVGSDNPMICPEPCKWKILLATGKTHATFTQYLDPFEWNTVVFDDDSDVSPAPEASDGRTSYLLNETVTPEQELFDVLATHVWPSVNINSTVNSKIRKNVAVEETADYPFGKIDRELQQPITEERESEQEGEVTPVGFQRLASEPDSDAAQDNGAAAPEFSQADAFPATTTQNECASRCCGNNEETETVDDTGVVAVIGKGAKKLCEVLASSKSDGNFYKTAVRTKYYKANVRFCAVENVACDLTNLKKDDIHSIILMADHVHQEKSDSENASGKKVQVWVRNYKDFVKEIFACEPHAVDIDGPFICLHTEKSHKHEYFCAKAVEEWAENNNFCFLPRPDTWSTSVLPAVWGCPATALAVMREMDESEASYWLEELTEALACHQWPGLEMCEPPSTPARAAPPAAADDADIEINVNNAMLNTPSTIDSAAKSDTGVPATPNPSPDASPYAGPDPRLANAVAEAVHMEGLSSDDEDGMGMGEFECLMREIQSAHHEASDLSDEQRKARAERLGMQMCRLLGESEGDDSAYEEEVAPSS